MQYGMQGYGYQGYQGYSPMGEYFLTGANGFGAVPVDQNTAMAYALIQTVDAGQDPAVVLAAADAATRQTVCQRAVDILNLPACTAAQDGTDGTCLMSGLTQTPSALKTKIAAACKAQGTSVTGAGMSTTTMLLIGAGVLAGGFLLYKVMHK